MKYRIPEHITIQTIDSETIKDVIYHELDEQEFLIEILTNPNLSYWKIYTDTHKELYSDQQLMVTVKDSVVTNHTKSR